MLKNLGRLKKSERETTHEFLKKHGLTQLEAKRYTDLNFKFEPKRFDPKKKKMLDDDFQA